MNLPLVLEKNTTPQNWNARREALLAYGTAHAHKSYIAAGRQNCHEEEHDRISHHHMAAYICAHS